MIIHKSVCLTLVLVCLCWMASANAEQRPAVEEAGGVSMSNLEIIKSTYEGKNSQENGANLRKHVSADIEWTEAAGFPYAGTYVGFDEIAQNVFQRLATEWIDYKFQVEDYVAEGDQVVAYGTYSGTYAATGESFTARVAHVWKLEKGKIVRFEQFVDSKPVLDAMRR